MLLGSGRELASRFQKFGSHLLKVLHFIPMHFAGHNRTDFGKRCLFGIGHNAAQGEQRQRPRQKAEAVRPARGTPPSVRGSIDGDGGARQARREKRAYNGFRPGMAGRYADTGT
jgi:hypothetical protein